MGIKLQPGYDFPPLTAANIHGKNVSIPGVPGRWTHVQFRRFAECPICNLHLQSYLQRANEIEAAGIREVVIFHSSDNALLPFQGSFPFDVIGDPEKRLYRRYGVESSLLSILSPAVWPALIKGNLVKKKPSVKGFPEGGPLGLPADFLVSPDGKILASYYGKHAYDQWSVDELLGMRNQFESLA